MEPKIPEGHDIEAEINGGRPSIALLSTRFLEAEQPYLNYHFNVITGFENNFVFANDPLRNEENGGKKKYKMSDFLYGLYVTCGGDLDNGSILKIRKK